jgi:RimJ/RimL family protein N-acetyltransferase
VTTAGNLSKRLVEGKGTRTNGHSASDPEVGEQPIINIVGEKVALGPWSRAVVPLVNRWDNDFAVGILSGDAPGPVVREATEADVERAVRGEPRHSSLPFVIYELATMRPIGVTDLRHINYQRRTAEFGVAIGEKDYWGKGYGTEAVTLVLDYAFSVLGLHNVMLDTNSFNERAIRCYRRVGFKEIGRRREAQRLGDRIYDVVYMDCLATEFKRPLKGALELP